MYNLVEVPRMEEVFVYNYMFIVYITNQFQSLFLKGGGGRVKSVSRGDCKKQGENS
jgi:hypothetical protein